MNLNSVDNATVESEILLNDAQNQIVDHIFSSILVLAPVGTGKTLTLAERATKQSQVALRRIGFSA